MDASEEYGPALPPAMQQSSGQSSTDTPTIGPALPPGYIKQEPSNSPNTDNTEETSAAVAAIGSEDSEHQGEGEYEAGGAGTIGPLVSEMSHGDEVVQAAAEFEQRSRKMKDHLTVKAEAQPGPSKREEWMTELPPEMGKNYGLTARNFSKGGGTDDKDRSEWTDTPADKAKKEKDSKGNKKRKRDDPAEKTVTKRDQQMQQQVDEYNKKKRPESLVEMHQKQKKKKKKKEKKKKERDRRKGKEEKQPERRAFDRDQDLKANHFDDAQRKAIIKRSAELNTRFSHSHTSSSFL